jgi:hypothetical protein
MLGHSVAVSEARCGDLIRTKAETIEVALGIEKLMPEVTSAVLR